MRSTEQKKFIKYCEDKGGRLYKNGKKKYEFKCLCPFHREDSPSFTFDKSTLFFYCFGCGAGGRGYDKLIEQETENERIREDVRKFCESNNITRTT